MGNGIGMVDQGDVGADHQNSHETLTAANMPAGAVIFTHIDDETGKVTTYSVTHLWLRVKEAMRAGKLKATRIPVDRDFAKYCREHRGIEKHRLQRIKTKHLDEPLLMATQPSGTHLMVDGHHRYVKAANLMKRTLPAYVLPPSFWASCVVEMGEQALTPEDLKRMFSGIN